MEGPYGVASATPALTIAGFPMKVGIFTFGSRGDVQPYLGLAVGLRQAGHDVFLCAPSDFAELVATHGVPFRPLSLSFKEMQSRGAHTQLLTNRFTGIFRRQRLTKLIGDAINRDAWRIPAGRRCNRLHAAHVNCQRSCTQA